jgi:hypothetical protein
MTTVEFVPNLQQRTVDLVNKDTREVYVADVPMSEAPRALSALRKKLAREHTPSGATEAQAYTRTRRAAR